MIGGSRCRPTTSGSPSTRWVTGSSRWCPRRCSATRNFWAWWKRVESEAGVRHRKPHMMRHTFATDVLDATEGNLYAVQGLLGHSSTRVTETYLHSSRMHMQAAVAGPR